MPEARALAVSCENLKSSLPFNLPAKLLLCYNVQKYNKCLRKNFCTKRCLFLFIPYFLLTYLLTIQILRAISFFNHSCAIYITYKRYYCCIITWERIRNWGREINKLDKLKSNNILLFVVSCSGLLCCLASCWLVRKGSKKYEVYSLCSAIINHNIIIIIIIRKRSQVKCNLNII